MRRLVISLAIVTGALILNGHRPARAYATNGHTWATSQVPFYVNPDNLYVSVNEAITDLQMAAMNWASQSNANVQLVYAGTTNGSSAVLNYKNEIFFRNESNGSLGAVTYWWYDGTGHLVDADTVFYEASYLFFAGNAGCHDNGEYIQDLATHEFGHTLGLAHSAVESATMYPTNTYCDTSWETLDPDDVSGIESLYPPSQSAPTPTAPAAPSALSATPNSSNPSSSISLGWKDNGSNASGYNVERSPDGSSFATVSQLGASATTFVDSGLASGAVYYYRVKAYNSSGSSYSNIASTQTQSAPAPAPAPVTQAPAAPSGPSPADGSTNQNSSNVTLSWKAAAGAQSYDVYFGTGTPGLYQSNVTGTSVKAPSMSGGATYYWQVIAKNSAGNTASSIWRYTTKATGKK